LSIENTKHKPENYNQNRGKVIQKNLCDNNYFNPTGDESKILRSFWCLVDPFIFAFVWLWVLLFQSKQYQLYLNLSKKKNRLPNPVLPQCANDKFFWRKIFDHDPRFTTISDKLAVKNWVTEENINVKTARVLWSGEAANQIPKEILKGEVVLKANHGWNMNILLQGRKHNYTELIMKANSFLNMTHGHETGEWGYLNIPRKLFVEEMLAGGGAQLIELKYYTFGNKIERLIVIYDRFGEIAADVWMADNSGILYLSDEKASVSDIRPGLPLPPTHKHAEKIACDIGSRFDHMRVDLFTDGQEVWLNELTVYNLSGHMAAHGFEPTSPLNTAWDLRRSWFLTTSQQGWRKLYAKALIRKLDRKF
jgi:hypothetical protein